MSFITLVLIAKIIVTGIMTAVPFLFQPAERLAARTGAGVGGATLFRLYGIAILAVLVGYASGFWLIGRGESVGRCRDGAGFEWRRRHRAFRQRCMAQGKAHCILRRRHRAVAGWIRHNTATGDEAAVVTMISPMFRRNLEE
jgi:hypothetical protein